MKDRPKISIVSPVYKAEAILEKLVSELNSVLNRLEVSYEIILVDDRSPDTSWEVMKELSSKHSEVKSIRLSRNFGQLPAIIAGLSQSKGEWVVVMDCDLQDQPKEIEKLYKQALAGYDVVLAKRINRQDSFFKRITSRLFYKVFNFLAGVNVNDEIANFGIYNRKVINSSLQIGDVLIFFPLFIKWVGYKQTAIEIEHSERLEGASSYSWTKLIKLAFNTIISFSDKPLRLFLGLGIFISSLSFLGAIYVLIKALNNEIAVLGYSSIFISICFFSGIIITILGVLGIYLGKSFNQSKNRPVFIIDDVYNK